MTKHINRFGYIAILLDNPAAALLQNYDPACRPSIAIDFSVRYSRLDVWA